MHSILAKINGCCYIKATELTWKGYKVILSTSTLNEDFNARTVSFLTGGTWQEAGPRNQKQTFTMLPSSPRDFGFKMTEYTAIYSSPEAEHRALTLKLR